MSQLVGKNCVICAKRIDSILEGKFCPACNNPVHMDCTLADVPAGANVCNVCGSPAALSARSAAAGARSPDPRGPSIMATYWALRLFLGAVLSFTFGIAFLFVPQLHDNPNELSTQELILGVGLILGGLILLGLTIRLLRRDQP